ncbi:MAG: DegT/DnrJ/EryC1/StrS family aminotransferase [Pseudomonadales bacterium]|nr:DegT/DnrJ/EryC1/StrS family aminotransferase [Pseudomonadales bacterium]
MEIKTVPFFNYPYVYSDDEDRILDIIADVGRRGAFIMQEDLTTIESNIASYCNTKYAVGVANATDGLQLGLMAGGIGKDDEVIFCSHTMVATASAIYFAGGVPVPINTNEAHTLDVEDIERVITPKTRAIMPTQLNGRISDMDAIQRLANKHNLLVFEDAAQALGARYKGQYAGTFGVASAISFYPAKTLGCLGDAGIVLTNDDEVYAKLLQLRDHGRDATGEVVSWGMNSRLDNLQAAILDFRFKSYKKTIQRRRAIASQYHSQLSHLNELKLPPSPDGEGDYFDVFQNYEVEAEDRDKLREFLSERGVGTILQWGGKAVHQFKKLGFTNSLPYTEALFEKMFLLPLHLAMSDDDVSYVAHCIDKYYR